MMRSFDHFASDPAMEGDITEGDHWPLLMSLPINLGAAGLLWAGLYYMIQLLLS